MGPGGFFPSNPDLANILGDTDFEFEFLFFLFFLGPKFPDVQVPKFWIYRFPNFWISRFPDFHTDGQAGVGGGGRLGDITTRRLKLQPEDLNYNQGSYDPCPHSP